MKAVKIKLDEYTQTFRKVQNDLEHHKQVLRLKADSDLIREIQSSLSEYTPLYNFNVLQNKLPSFAKLAGMSDFYFEQIFHTAEVVLIMLFMQI